MKRILLKHMLTPEYIFDKYSDVTPEFLLEKGIRGLLIDIDNTLAPYEQEYPDENIIAWLNALKKNGITPALISNNDVSRVERFTKDLDILAYPNSKKPSTKTIRIAMKAMGTDRANTAGLGDQLLTDTLAVHRMDMMSIIVPPINDRLSFFFKFKRKLERPYIRRYYRLQRKKAMSEAKNETN